MKVTIDTTKKTVFVIDNSVTVDELNHWLKIIDPVTWKDWKVVGHDQPRFQYQSAVDTTLREYR